MSSGSNAVVIAERTVQDTANLATTAGINATTIVSGVTGVMPGPTIKRGIDMLKKAETRLQDNALPADMENKFYDEHRRLWAKGEQLVVEKRKLGSWNPLQVTLIPKALTFETKATALHDDVDMSSYWYESNKRRRYAPSVRTLDSGWETIRPPTPPVPSALHGESEALLVRQPAGFLAVNEEEGLESVELLPYIPAADPSNEPSSTDTPAT